MHYFLIVECSIQQIVVENTQSKQRSEIISESILNLLNHSMEYKQQGNEYMKYINQNQNDLNNLLIKRNDLLSNIKVKHEYNGII